MPIKDKSQLSKNLIYPKLSYKLTGIFYKIHNDLGRFYRERQYADAMEELFKKEKLNYKREYDLSNLEDRPTKGNRVDFIIENKILIDIKAKKFITKEDYFQMLRYLDVASLRLGLIVNFRNTYLKPKRVLNSKLASLA